MLQDNQQSGTDETEMQRLYELVLANFEETKRLGAEMQKQAAAAATDQADFQVFVPPSAVSLMLHLVWLDMVCTSQVCSGAKSVAPCTCP